MSVRSGWRHVGNMDVHWGTPKAQTESETSLQNSCLGRDQYMWCKLSDILLFTGIMRKEFYVDKILRGQLVPFIKECFPNGNYRFQQDNDPKHKSKCIF